MSFILSDVEVIQQTDSAILVEAGILDDDVWVPNSQVDDESEVHKMGDSGDLVVSDWFASKKGWLDE